MKKIKWILLTTVFASIHFAALHAQTKFDVPQNVELKSKEDYLKYENSMIDAAKWLEETDLDKETEKRQQINSFVVQWISGTPDITVDITKELGKVYAKNVQLLGLYIASYARNFLENKNSSTKFTATKAGLISIMNVYKKGIKITKSKEMDKLIRLTDDNKLDVYIKDKFK